MSDTRVILADDHVLVRAGIRALLEKIPGIQVVGEASNGAEALGQVQQHLPDLALVDITMGSTNGLETAAHIKQYFPGVRVLMLSMHAHEFYVRQARRIGVNGYLLKDEAREALGKAIQTVMEGETYLSPQVAAIFTGADPSDAVKTSASLERLTPRQREILRLIAEGKSTKEIAGQLQLSPKTVETHRATLMERLNIDNIPGLVRYAVRAGLVSA